MAPPVQSLVTDLDADQWTAEFVSLLELLGWDTTGWEPGDWAYDVSKTVVRWFCKAWNASAAPALRAQFLRYAFGGELTEAAWARYNRPRHEATFAEGDVVIESRGTYVGTIGVGTVRLVNAAGKSFTNTSAAFMALWSGVGAYPTCTLAFRADEAGADSNTASNALPTYPTALRTAPGGALFVQSNAALVGADEEGDALLKRRCELAAAEEGWSTRARIEAIARDPIGAMRRAGLPIPATWPKAVGVTRVRVEEPGNGVVNVWLASAGGAASGSTTAVDSDVYICNLALQTLAAPPGGTLNVAPAVEKAISYGLLGLWVRRETNQTKTAAEVAAGVALAEFFSTLPIGGERLVAGGQGFVLLDHVLAAAMKGAGAYHAGAQLITSNVPLASNEVTVATYTPNVALVTQGV